LAVNHCRIYLIRGVNGLVHTENALRKSERLKQAFAADFAHKQPTMLVVFQTQVENKKGIPVEGNSLSNTSLMCLNMLRLTYRDYP
jgi:hypothetical protein